MSANTPTKECKSISSGEIAVLNKPLPFLSAFGKVSQHSKCFSVENADKRQYLMRIVTEPNPFRNVGAVSDCNLIINNEPINEKPYESTNGELVFVTKTIPGVTEQNVLIHCSDLSAEINAVGLFDEILNYGDQAKSITVESGQIVNVLFTATNGTQKIDVEPLSLFLESDSLDLMQDIIEKSAKQSVRRLMDSKEIVASTDVEMRVKNAIDSPLQADKAGADIDATLSERSNSKAQGLFDTNGLFGSIFNELFSFASQMAQEAEVMIISTPDLKVSLEWDQDNIEPQRFVSKAIALDGGSTVDFEVGEEINDIKTAILPAVSDYVLHFESDETVSFILNSDVIEHSSFNGEDIIQTSKDIFKDLFNVDNKDEFDFTQIHSSNVNGKPPIIGESMVDPNRAVLGMLFLLLPVVILCGIVRIRRRFQSITNKANRVDAGIDAEDEESISGQYHAMNDECR